MGLLIGYFVHNHGAPLRVSAVLSPFLGTENVDGLWGKLIDGLAVFATLGGTATSLGFIGSQFVTVIRFKWDINLGDTGIMARRYQDDATGYCLASTRVKRGIRRLSNFNMVGKSPYWSRPFCSVRRYSSPNSARRRWVVSSAISLR